MLRDDQRWLGWTERYQGFKRRLDAAAANPHILTTTNLFTCQRAFTVNLRRTRHDTAGPRAVNPYIVVMFADYQFQLHLTNNIHGGRGKLGSPAFGAAENREHGIDFVAVPRFASRWPGRTPML